MKLSFWCVLLCFLSGVVQAQEKVTLEQVIAAALEKNYDVLLAKNASSSASTDKGYSVGVFFPQINAATSVTNNSSYQQLGFSDPSKDRNGETKSVSEAASISVVYTLFDGTKMFATRARIASMARQGEVVVKDQMVNTISQIILNYYNIVRQKQQLNAILELMAVNEERVKLADRKLSVGIGAKPELLQAKVDLNAQRTQALQQETNISVLKEQLNNLTGMSLPENYDVADSIVINLDLKLDELADNIEQNNYSLLVSKWNLEIANNTIWERRAAYFPTISVNSSYGYTNTNNIILLNPFGTKTFLSNGFISGATISIPIFNSLNNRRLVEQGKINRNRQQLLFDQQKLTVNMGLKNAFFNYENAKKVLLIEEENILLAKENVEIALESFRRGVSTFIELRTAQQSLADAYNRLIAARYNAKTSETELLRLRGALLK